METIQDKLDALTHKLLHQRQGLVGIRAGDVAAGTFGAGDFIFPSNLTISNVLTVSASLTVPWIELRNTAGNAAIDFTRTPGTGDFNVRLENNTDNMLYLFTASAADSTTGGRMQIGNAWIGSHPVHGASSWAAFGHKNLTASGDYQILCNANGETLFNCSGSMKRFRFFEGGNNEWLAIDVNAIHCSRSVNLNGNSLWIKAWGDNTHRIQRDAGNDGISYVTWGYHIFYTQGEGTPRCYIGNGRGVYGKSNNAAWDSAGIATEYMSWGGTPSVGWASPGAAGQRFTMEWGGSWAIYGRRNDGASTVLILDVVDESGQATKRDIKALEKGHVQKVKQLKPKRYKRRPDPHDVVKFEQDIADGKLDAEFVAKMRAEQEHEFVGFIAEEMAEVYPEVVYYRDGVPTGIRYGHLASILVQAVQELDERLDKLETGRSNG